VYPLLDSSGRGTSLIIKGEIYTDHTPKMMYEKSIYLEIPSDST